MSKDSIGIGIVGAGTVGGGVVKLLTERADQLHERTGGALALQKVADLDAKRLAELGLAPEQMTDDYKNVIADDSVDIVVELVGGTGIAFDVVAGALRAGKPVVTANKALLAERGDELFAISKETGQPLCFEAAVAGAIPIIRAIRDGYVADRLTGLLGIRNGTCNYILTQMLDEGQSYEDALADAQKLGYAEADPTFDVEGNDTAHKLALIAALGFGTVPDYNRIPIEGISRLRLDDVMMAAQFGYVVKLLAVARPQDDDLYLSVHPALLSDEHPMANVKGSMNAISLFADAAQEAMFYGRGAGELPTASAVLSDVVSLARGLSAGHTPYAWRPSTETRYALADFDNYRCRYFLRFTVRDQYGVLGRITTALGNHKVSIASVIQHEEEEDSVPVVLLTHEAREGDVRAALAEISAMDFNLKPAGFLRVEE